MQILCTGAVAFENTFCDCSYILSFIKGKRGNEERNGEAVQISAIWVALAAARAAIHEGLVRRASP